MGEDIIEFDGIRDTMQGIIKVIGVGGGGCNAVRNMYNDQIQGVDGGYTGTGTCLMLPELKCSQVL